jgi:competence protein ComEC
VGLVRSPHPSLAVLVGIAVLVAVALLRTDDIRDRAESGVARGMPQREAALARGFVLGEDEQIDAVTREDFRGSGLSHLLAVSGQNVTLLALLAMPLLAAFGIPLRERLIWVLALIAIYVPLAGAGPSIQRAGVMGAAGVLATLGGRRSSRLYALALAFLVTSAIDPGIAGDVGWQLSFAAVLGILLLAPPLRRALRDRLGSGALAGALAEGVAVTVAATLATAPLIAFYFESLSTTTLVANLLAMPAVAPSMWLGMASAALSQVPGLPVEVLNLPNALLLGYIAQVAVWCGRPGWAQLHLELGPGGLAASYALVAAGWAAIARLARRARLASLRQYGLATGEDSHRYPGERRSWRIPLIAFVALAALLIGLWLWPIGGSGVAGAPAPLRIEVIDVGQGDAILLRPATAPAILVDGGPPGDHLEAELRAAGVERLGAVVITHDQSDHAGGIEELLGRFPVGRLLFARLDRRTLTEADAAGVEAVRVGAGGALRSGQLSVEVLWPPRELLAAPARGADPNQLAIVLLARWHHFSMLLTADAEAEAVPLDPGPVDVLKVAHHGSADAGLAGLLDRTGPSLAVISVGADNPYGHPDPSTLATLAAHGVRTLRTDRDGGVTIAVRHGSFGFDVGS